MSKEKMLRNPALDLIRCVALFCVVGVHFFINIGFHSEAILGFRMYIMTLLRSAMQVCVPLFMLLSGYLLRFRKPTKSYYKKIIHTLSVYCFASIFCIAYQNIEGSNPVSLKEAISGIFGFYSAPYAWYVEMYIGLFLIIPFLNVMYNNLENKTQKQMLILVLLCLTTIPSIANIWRFFDLQWWIHPSSSSNYNTLFPDWWVWMYPVTYYCIGCYLNEYPLKIRRSLNFLLFIISVFCTGSFCYYRSYNASFVYGVWQDSESPLIMLQAVLLFSFLANLNLDSLSTNSKKILALISDWSLGAYLVSWVFEQVFYKVLNSHQPIMQHRLAYFLIIIPLVYICSIGGSAVINILLNLISKSIHCIKQKFNSAKV